jgi:hypothetical protein
MNRRSGVVAISLLLALSVAVSGTVLTADPLTKVPLDPATVGVFGTNPPDKLPDSRYCGSEMRADL